jgi:hypothetical protein
MFEFDLLDLTEDIEIMNRGKKTIYNVDDKKSGRDWVKNKNGKIKTKEVPPLSSPFNVKQKKGTKIATEGFLATMLAGSNNVYCNTQLVGLISSGYSVATLPTIQVTERNLFESVAYFTSRKLTKGDWGNWYDEYLAPNEQHELFEQFKYDSLVYSLFESKSNQSSLRQVEYKDQLWDIKNEFFWMSADRIKTLADNMGYDELYNDARTSPDRHVYKLLFGEERIYDKLSPDAKAVLDKATELVELSMEMRQVMANDENHLNSWDAGYAQLKLVWKEYFPEQFKEFRQLYKNMEERIRPLVYDLGFLMK